MATTEGLDPFRRDPAPKQEHINKVKAIHPLARAEYSNKWKCWHVYAPYLAPKGGGYAGFYAGPSAKNPADAWEYAAEEMP